MLKAKGKQPADVLDPETLADTRHVLDLIDAFGVGAGVRVEVVEELGRRSEHVSDEVDVRFDPFDRATLAGVWTRGVRERRGTA